MKKTKGFTLVEILIALGMMAIVMGIASLVMFSVLRSSRKSAAIAAAKTEGAYALRSMSQMILFSKRIVNCNSNSVTVEQLDTTQTTYSINGTRIASGSAYLTSSGVAVASCVGGFLTCESNDQVVRICFVINRASGVDVTDYAGPDAANGVLFSAQVRLRNFGN